MTNPSALTDATDERLSAAVEENLFALFRALAESLDGELVEGEGLSHHLAFPTNPMYKGAWRTRLPPGDVDEAIDRTVLRFRERGAPFFFWWTGPGTQPADLGLSLAEHGLIDMAEQAQEMAPGMVSTDLGAPCMVADLGRLDGEPVATNILFNGAGVSGIFGVATAPAARRKGIGAAISLKPLLDAREMGYRYGVLWATDLAVRVYERIGFQLTGRRINRYLWRNT